MLQNKTPRIRKNGALGWLAFALVIYLFALQSCASLPESSFAPPTSALLSTTIPPYVATDQASAKQARSTIQAGEAQAYNLALTGTAVAVDVNYQTTLVSLNLTQSAATEQYFIRQTQASGEATATASQVAAGGTATTVSMASTSAAGTQQTITTGTAQAATATQVGADNQVHATATQLAINELIRRDESQRQTLLFRTWALRLALALLFAFGLLLIWKATPWLLLKFFGFQSWNGKPIIVIPDKNGGFKIADIARSLGPGLEFDQNNRLITSGSAPDIQVQNAVTARAQAAELLLTAGSLPAETKKRILRQTAALSASTGKLHPSLPPEIADVEFKVLPAEDQQVGAWLRDVEPELLDAGE